MCDKLPFPVGSKLKLTDIMLIGTKDYTVIGRPKILGATVYATIEEQTLSQKIIIFKKKRRQGYQKNMGHRQSLTILRIEKIEHEMTQEMISNHKRLDQEGNSSAALN